MKNLIKSKIFVIFTIFIGLLFILSISSFASTDLDVTMSDGEELHLTNVPDLPYSAYYVVKTYYGGSFYIYIYNWDYNNGDFLFVNDISNSAGSTDKFDFKLSCYNKFSSLESGSKVSNSLYYCCSNANSTSSWGSLSTASIYSSSVLNATYYTTHALYNIDNIGSYTDFNASMFDEINILFQGAPQELALVEPMKIQQVEEIPQKIVEILMIVLPVCLTVFGVLLVLFLIKSKNLLHL